MTGRTPVRLHGELAAMIGREGPEIRGRLERRDIERYAVASGETTPIYFDESAARAAGYGGVPSPPTMLTSVIEWGAGPTLGDLRADGTGVGREGWLPLEGFRLMGGGQDLEIHAPALAGTSFTARPRLEDAQLKTGGAGELVLMTITTRYSDVDGADLVTCRETLIAR